MMYIGIRLVALLLGIAFSLSATAASALPEISEEQIEAFRNLPPEEQAKLIEALQQSGARNVQETQIEQPGTTTAPTDAEAADEAGVESASAESEAEPADAEAPTAEEAEEVDEYLDEVTGLPYFGYDVFAGVPTTFAPVTDIPIPVEYVIGPGDMVAVQLFGKEPASYTLSVNRDGAINFPELGPIMVSGLTFEQMRSLLQERVAEQMIGASVSVTLGELRSIRVFVLGEANRPGAYTVSSLSTITNALLSSGGVDKRGSLRNIELKRAGEIVTNVDLYDLLLRGDTSADARLMQGDVIFIPPVGAQVAVGGQVARPAIYELKGESTVGDALQLAGGAVPTAYPQGTTLSRIDAYQQRVQQDLDLRSPEGQGAAIRKGDVLTVPSILDDVDNTVILQGNVRRPGPVQYRPGMYLSDVLPSIDDVKPASDLNYVLIRRESEPARRVVALSADLEAALRAPRGPADVRLMPRDQVRVFMLGNERPDVEALVDELRLQATLDRLAPIVRIGGQVRAPGTYPLEADMHVSDLLRAGGALAESAYAVHAEITRYEVVNGEQRQIDLIEVDLAAIRRGDAPADVPLKPYDFLNVRQVSDWGDDELVEFKGEVRFPGTYPIRKGETLLMALQRAGGLTERAYPNGAIFTRTQLREREQKQIDDLINRMELDLATLSLQQAQDPTAMIARRGAGVSADMPDTTLATGQGLLGELRNTTAVGRLAMDFPRMLASPPGSPADVVLQDGDVLMVPGAQQSVTVIGEVNSPTSLLYENGLKRDDYINLSGGLTRRADASRIYVVKANGQVAAGRSKRWFNADATDLTPGDTIVVPADLERVRPLPLWTSVSSIVFNLAVAVAAVNSF
jgi:polysaccharide export outer membrane protein